ncbi:MAG: DUF389 domain-containing protein [Bacteroidales bacterium]|jgi:uncharacterized hydrophobic protein (TIGR00271 family)|nr:DUF389 domain-containing protein [Bacteroidales bacterium]
MSNFRQRFKDIVNISRDVDWAIASESIRSSIYFRGPNVWILAAAIIVASIGLNVNSIPVIIGAMLISPLMGPIMGFGLGLGTNDTSLLKESLKHLGIMVLISIIASTLYFLVSPLKMDNPTELLARTNPTIYDVMIALFGGFAGILETSRKEKGTVISGVAIATALMPPLCTIGFGIATLQLKYAIGALYLFFINGVFIAMATFIMVKYLRFPLVKVADSTKQKKVSGTIAAFTLVLIVPSIISAIMVIHENRFNQNARKFISENRNLDKSYIYDHEIKHEKTSGTLTLYMAGEPLDLSEKELLYRSAEMCGIGRDQLTIIENAIIREELSQSDMMKSFFEKSDREIKQREDLLLQLQEELKTIRARELPVAQIARELLTQYPDLTEFSISRGSEVTLSDLKESERIFVMVKWKEPMDDEVVTKLQKWLCVRLETENIIVIQDKE